MPNLVPFQIARPNLNWAANTDWAAGRNSTLPRDADRHYYNDQFQDTINTFFFKFPPKKGFFVLPPRPVPAHTSLLIFPTDLAFCSRFLGLLVFSACLQDSLSSKRVFYSSHIPVLRVELSQYVN